MRRRLRFSATRRTAGAALVAALGLASAAAIVAAGRGGTDDPSARAQPPTATAVVKRQNLVARESFEGSLGYADKRSLASVRSGTVTALRREGETVRRGGVLYRVDDKPVILLYGAYPLWRTLEEGVDGQDVEQLERNLVALGYDPDGDIEVDGEFDWATEAAVERWQGDIGVTDDGSVEPDDAVFLPGPRRIGQVETVVGSRIAAGAPVMDTTSTRRVVTLDLDARRQTLVRRGQRVEIELPNGRIVPGRIARVGTVAKMSQDGSPTIEVTINVPRGRAAGGLDQATVDVGIAREIRRAVLTVPVTALLAVAGGGYAVEVVDGETTKLVRVTPGLFADGLVEIAGETIREGARVVVPR